MFLLGLGICVRSLTYPIGSFRSPGGGLFPLLASLILMGLSAGLTIQAFLEKGSEGTHKHSFYPAKESPRRILLGFISLVGFRYVLPIIGFAPSAFLFIFLLAKTLGGYGWRVSIFFGITTAVLAYYLFQAWLRIPTPVGILGI